MTLTLLLSRTARSFCWVLELFLFHFLLHHPTNSELCWNTEINIVWAFCYWLLRSSSVLRFTDLKPLNVIVKPNINVTSDESRQIKFYCVALFSVLFLWFVSEIFFWFVFIVSLSSICHWVPFTFVNCLRFSFFPALGEESTSKSSPENSQSGGFFPSPDLLLCSFVSLFILF